MAYRCLGIHRRSEIRVDKDEVIEAAQEIVSDAGVLDILEQASPSVQRTLDYEVMRGIAREGTLF
jgi:hypothetical protein